MLDQEKYVVIVSFLLMLSRNLIILAILALVMGIPNPHLLMRKRVGNFCRGPGCAASILNYSQIKLILMVLAI